MTEENKTTAVDETVVKTVQKPLRNRLCEW